jgi:hypothetical protein
VALYCTVTQLREYLPQIPASAATDAILTSVITRASQIIATETGIDFNAAALGTRVVYGNGTIYLTPPPFVAASVTAITAPAGYTVPDWAEQEGALVVASTLDVISQPFPYVLSDARAYALGGWGAGVPYTVAATFGYSGVPADIQECCLELAVQIWQGKDSGFNTVVGVQGAGVREVLRAYTPMMLRILDKYSNNAPGVW